MNHRASSSKSRATITAADVVAGIALLHEDGEGLAASTIGQYVSNLATRRRLAQSFLPQTCDLQGEWRRWESNPRTTPTVHLQDEHDAVGLEAAATGSAEF